MVLDRFGVKHSILDWCGSLWATGVAVHGSLEEQACAAGALTKFDLRLPAAARLAPDGPGSRGVGTTMLYIML